MPLGAGRVSAGATPALTFRPAAWRPWLKSNQQHAVLETTAAPPPHGQTGLSDGIRTRLHLLHRQTAHHIAFTQHRTLASPDDSLRRYWSRTSRRIDHRHPARTGAARRIPTGLAALQGRLARRATRRRIGRYLKPQLPPYQGGGLPLDLPIHKHGAEDRARTDRLFVTSEVLYHHELPPHGALDGI